MADDTDPREGKSDGMLSKISLNISELPVLKKFIIGDRPYTDRVSIGFCMQLLRIREQLNEDGLIIDEMDALEGGGITTTRRPPEKFKHPPLDRFFHKHVSMPRHILTNIGIHWGLHDSDPAYPEKARKKWLDRMINEVAREHGNDPDRWQAELAHRFTMMPMERRGPKGLTGDWLIYGVHEGRNYYLGYSAHTKDDTALYQMLKNLSAFDFPWFFEAVD